MFLYHYLLPILCAVHLVAARTAHSPETLLKEKCRQNSQTDDAFYNFLNKTNEIRLCFENAVINITDPERQWRTGCQIFRNEAYNNCFVPTVDSFSACLSEEELFFPEYLKSTYISLLDTFCVEDIVDKIKKVKHFMETKPCSQHTFNELFNMNPFEELNIVKNVESGRLTVSQEEMCSDLGTAHHIFKSYFAERCTQDFINMVEIVVQPYFEWCNKN